MITLNGIIIIKRSNSCPKGSKVYSKFNFDVNSTNMISQSYLLPSNSNYPFKSDGKNHHILKLIIVIVCK